MGLFRVSVFSFFFVWCLDWIVKAFPHGGWWIPHETHRSLWAFPLSAALLALLVSFMLSPAAAALAGAVLGGLAGNLVDLRLDGVVWNMIPVPFSDGLVCNVADVAIIGGFAALTVMAAIRVWKLPAGDLIPSD